MQIPVPSGKAVLILVVAILIAALFSLGVIPWRRVYDPIRNYVGSRMATLPSSTSTAPTAKTADSVPKAKAAEAKPAPAPSKPKRAPSSPKPASKSKPMLASICVLVVGEIILPPHCKCGRGKVGGVTLASGKGILLADSSRLTIGTLYEFSIKSRNLSQPILRAKAFKEVEACSK